MLKEGEQAKEPVVNAFGETPEVPEVPIVVGDEGKGEGDEGKGKEEKKTPTEQIAELSKKIGELSEKDRASGETHKSKDENIRQMRETIDRLTKAAKGDKPEGDKAPETLFKDIKRSKDLTADQKEEMTDTEIAQMDSIASLQEGMNTLAALVAKGADKPADGVLDVNSIVREEAKELSAGNKELANQIIESFNSMKFDVTGLSNEDVQKRVATAAKEVSTYKPAKEQSTGGKGKTAGASEDGADPYGVDKIVDEASKKREGGGYGL